MNLVDLFAMVVFSIGGSGGGSFKSMKAVKLE